MASTLNLFLSRLRIFLDIVKKVGAFAALLLAVAGITVAGDYFLGTNREAAALTRPGRIADQELQAKNVFAGASDPGVSPSADVNGERLPDGAVVRIGANRLRHGGTVHSMQYTPDGKSLASLSDDGYLYLWDAFSGKLRWRLPMDKESDERHLVVSNDSKRIAALSESKFLVVECESGKKLVEHKLAALNDEQFRYGAISPDLRTFAFGYQDCTVRLFDADTAREKKRIVVGDNEKKLAFMSLQFSADAVTIYVLTSSPSQIAAFDTKNGKETRMMDIPDRLFGFARLVTSPRRNLLAASLPGQVFLWDLKTGKDARVIKGAVLPFAAFSFDDQLIASAMSTVLGWATEIVVSDTGSGEQRQLLRAPAMNAFESQRPHSFAFAPDGKTLAVGDSGGAITLWDIATATPRPSSSELKGLWKVRFVNKGSQIVTFGDCIEWWDLNKAKSSKRLAINPNWSIAPSLSPDGKLLATWSVDGELVLSDTETGKRLRTLTGHKSPPQDTVFSPDGTTLFSGADGDRRIILWEVASGKVLGELEDQPGYMVNGLAVSPDGRWLASGRRDNNREGKEYEIRLWDVATGNLVHRLKSDGSAWALRFSADSTRLIAAGSGANLFGQARLWDVAAGKEIGAFRGHKNLVQGVSITPDGRMLATGSQDETLRLWEVATGMERGRITGHEASTFSLDFSPSGRLLAAASNDAPIYLWDAYALQKPKSPSKKLTPADAQRLWQKLADTDGPAAFQAICELIAHPVEAATTLEDQWKRLPRATPAQVHKWVDDLASEKFAVRKTATEELGRLAYAHEDLLRDALQKAVSLETRRRLETILGQVGPERLRQIRMLEVLDQVPATSARPFLQRLAKQKEDAVLAREAAAGIRRLEKR